MRLLWLKGSSKYQKIVSATVILLFIGPFITWMFTHNFVTAPRTSYLAVNISIILTGVSIIKGAYLYAKNLWRPGPRYNRYSLGAKIIGLPFIFGGALFF